MAINLSFNNYKSQFAKLPVDDFARSMEGFNQEYLKGVESMSMVDQLARSIKVSDMDSMEKDRRLHSINQAIQQFSKTGNFEDAPIAAMKLASQIKNDEWMQSAQERYLGMTEDMKKANELDVSDAQRYAMQKHFKAQGATPTQKNKLGTYGRYSAFDVFKEPNIQEELSKFMKDAVATYMQEIQQDGSIMYVKGDERKTKEDLIRLGKQYITNDPKMAKLLQYETDMHVDSASEQVKELTVRDKLSELRKTQKAYSDAGQTKEANYLDAMINQLSAAKSAKGGVDNLYKSLTQDKILNSHTANLAEAFAVDKQTISNLSREAQSGSSGRGSGNGTKATGAAYDSYTHLGSNIYLQKEVDDLKAADNSKSVWTNPLLAGTGDMTFGSAYQDDSGISIKKPGTLADKFSFELNSFYQSKDFKDMSDVISKRGDFQIATPKNSKKSLKQISEEILANSANIPAQVRIPTARETALIGIQENEDGSPNIGDGYVTLMLPKENGGGSLANIGNQGALEAAVIKSMPKGVTDIQLKYTKRGISPANAQGMPGAMVYTLVATGKDSNKNQVSQQFDVLKSNANKLVEQAYQPLQDMAAFAYSGKGGVQSFPLGDKEVIKIMNMPGFASDGTATIKTMVSSNNPARTTSTFDEFMRAYSNSLFKTQTDAKTK